MASAKTAALIDLVELGQVQHIVVVVPMKYGVPKEKCITGSYYSGL